MRKWIALLLTAMLTLAATSSALADPDESAVPTAEPTAEPTAAPEAAENLVVKEGDTGDNVLLIQMRLRDLGYYNYKMTGSFGAYTTAAMKSFQKENGLSADGVAGTQTLDVLYGNGAKRAPVKAVVKPVTPTTVKPASSKVKYGQLKEWSWVHSRWARGEKLKVIDFNTGKSYYMIRVGGYNHADVEPATKKDCAILKSTYGGSWSWDRRAVIFYLDGVWVAGSTNGMPHGYETVANNDMTGQVCIHALNSKTHIRNTVDPAHQRMVHRAAGK
ncbi:MAG: peptidoglycan-binding domain-containing protein [Eubacteriales bacterium]|nr:peptidoglycan-binding domain-containing protein [Eubacteriales bacterium]